MEKLLLIHFALCLFMCGLIWIVQMVQYPSFMYISKEKFEDFSDFHVKSISFIVFPIMIGEVFTSLIIIVQDQSTMSLLNFSLLVLTWLATTFLSVPLHNKLRDGFNEKFIKKLIFTNWPRTIFWSVRSIILFTMVLETGVISL